MDMHAEMNHTHAISELENEFPVSDQLLRLFFPTGERFIESVILDPSSWLL